IHNPFIYNLISLNKIPSQSLIVFLISFPQFWSKTNCYDQHFFAAGRRFQKMDTGKYPGRTERAAPLNLKSPTGRTLIKPPANSDRTRYFSGYTDRLDEKRIAVSPAEREGLFPSLRGNR